MKSEDRNIFINCLIGCAEITGKQLSEQAITIYWNSLKHLEINVVSDAFNRHIVNPDNGQFMPKPADIIRLCQGSNQDSALIAWSKVIKTIQSVGRYESVVFDDPAIMSCIQDMGGWVKLCSVEGDELPFKANEFEKRYKGYKTIGKTEFPCKLIGVYESTNSTNGLKIDPPILVGDKQEALLILNGGSNKQNIEFTPLNKLLLKNLPNKLISEQS